MFDTKQFTMPDGRRIAYRHIRGTGPALVFLPGYMSDMAGGKATAMFDWAGPVCCSIIPGAVRAVAALLTEPCRGGERRCWR